MPQAIPRPETVPVNLTGQWIMTIGCVVLAAIAVTFAVRLARTDRSPVPLVLTAAVAVGSLLEPLYDNAFHILWYLPGQWNLYSALDVPQPVWIWPAYLGTYGTGALYVYARARAGARPSEFVRPAVVTFVGYVAFEVVGVNLGTYTYYGSHPMRLLDFPVWVTPINMAISFAAGIAAALARRHTHGAAQPVAAALAFPFTFAMVAFGAGFPTLDVISEQTGPTALTYVAALVTIALAGATMWLSSLLLPHCSRTSQPAPAST